MTGGRYKHSQPLALDINIYQQYRFKSVFKSTGMSRKRQHVPYKRKVSFGFWIIFRGIGIVRNQKRFIRIDLVSESVHF